MSKDNTEDEDVSKYLEAWTEYIEYDEDVLKYLEAWEEYKQKGETNV